MRASILVLSLLFSLQSFAAFEENTRRYLSGQEVIQSLSVFFFLPSQCQRVTSANAAILGLNSPISGNPVSPAPTQALVQWISNCLRESFSVVHNLPQDREIWVSLLSEEAYQNLVQTFGNINVAMSQPWASLPVALQSQILEHMTYAMLGSDDTIQDFGLILDPSAFRLKLANWLQAKPQIQIKQALLFVSLNLVLRDEFLSY